MKQTIIRSLPKIICGIFVYTGYAACGFGQTTTQTITATMHTPPTGPNSLCTVDLTISPGTAVVSGFSILVGFQQDQGELLMAEDITGQASAAPFFSYGDDTPYDGTTYTATTYSDIYVPVIMDTADDLVNATSLVRLHFQTSATYSLPNNNFYVHIGPWALSGPEYGGLIGSLDDGFPRIPTAYIDLEPSNTSVEDWILY